MKGFLKIVFGSFIGFCLVIALGILILFSTAITGKNSTKVKVADNSVLRIDVGATLPDRTVDNPFAGLSPLGGASANFSMFELKKIIKKATKDDKVKGIYLTSDLVTEGMPNLGEIREALTTFKEAGKFIVSYNNFCTQRAYYLSSVATDVIVNPVGMMEFDGMSMETMFFKKMFDKLEIEPIPLYSGKYKGASEPFRLEEMSDNNRKQLKDLLDDVYGSYIQTIAETRNIPKEDLLTFANNLEILDPKDALTRGLIDKLMYEDEVYDLIKSKLGLEEDEKLKFLGASDYKGSWKEKRKRTKNEIAVIFAEGNIVAGEGDDGSIGGEKFMKLVRKIRKDEKVKAVVLRVNSPGGSAFASDQIWRELVLLKEEKPLVVSMGQYAASGGYYIACMADKIFADENTITGSIGVVGIMLNFEDFMANKIGLTFDREKTGPYADFGNVMRDWTQEEIDAAQKQVTKIYMDFKTNVAKGRGMNIEEVQEIAQGRVWTGQDAIEVGLVDELGGFEEALAEVASLAELGDDYITRSYPEPVSFFEQLMSGMGTSAKAEAKIKEQIGPFYPYLQALRQAEAMSGIQMRMPFNVEIK